MKGYERDPVTYGVIGAAMEVHTELGPGFLEAVYAEALAIEFERRRIGHVREVILEIRYKDNILSNRYRADFIVEAAVVLELKATKDITDLHTAQAIHYLKATGLSRGLILNFGSSSLQFRRAVYRDSSNK